MTLDARNLIAPQMSEYDKVGEQWVPYLMRADGASKSFASVNTDRWGLRHSIGRAGKLLTVDTLSIDGTDSKIGVVLGSSAVFGVGSTHDQHTIPSYLSQETDTKWLNLGGRAYNSTQELIKLMLYLPAKLDHIVICSGVNNITLAFLSSSTSPVYNSFFSQSVFELAMSNPSGEYIGVRRAFERLRIELRHRFFPKSMGPARLSIDAAYQNILTCFERDLRVAKAIAAGMGVPIYFALQPLATWIDKKFSQEELAIFKTLDAMSSDWQVLAHYIGEVKDRYFTDVAKICGRHAVKYCNLNYAHEFKSQEWLFVDRVHLTDRGCEIVAAILKREFLL